MIPTATDPAALPRVDAPHGNPGRPLLDLNLLLVFEAMLLHQNVTAAAAHSTFASLGATYSPST